jgi:CHAT domain-containing protein
LVTLSACETGFADLQRAPHEFGGLPTAFLMSGARSVVSSLWPMHDIPTALLMGEFYRLMREDPAADIPRTLRRAELWLCSAEKAALKAWIAAQERTRSLADLRNWRVRWQLLQIRFELWRWRGNGAPFRHPYYWAGFVPLTVHG